MPSKTPHIFPKTIIQSEKVDYNSFIASLPLLFIEMYFFKLHNLQRSVIIRDIIYRTLTIFKIMYCICNAFHFSTV